MTKRGKDSGEETFPVDTLGIPILVDVVEAGSEPVPEDPVDRSAAASAAPGTRPDPDREAAGEDAGTVDLERIARSVTGEIMAELEPLVREKIRLALRTFQQEAMRRTEGSLEGAPEKD